MSTPTYTDKEGYIHLTGPRHWFAFHQKELKDASTRVAFTEKWLSIPIPKNLEGLRALDDDFAVTQTEALISKLASMKETARSNKTARDAAGLSAPAPGATRKQRKAARRVQKEQAKDIASAQREAEDDGDFSHLRYGPEERKKDRQRLVRVDSVLAALTYWENEMVIARVGSPVAAFLAPWKQWLKMGSFLAHNWRTLLQAFKLAVEEPGIWGLVLATVLLAAASSCADAATFAKGLGSSLHIRELAAEKIREAALPQRPDTRHRRTKRTRV